jgi:hypothetical protein
MDVLPADVLDHEVAGSNLDQPDDTRPPTLRDQLASDRPTLLVLLRHFGCIFCRETIKDVRTAAEQADGNGGERRGYPRVVFVHMGDPESGGRFVSRYWPAAAAISDPDKQIYGAVDLPRGSVGQMFAPKVWACGIRAARKGHRIGRAVGDPWQMPGVLLLDPPLPSADATVLYRHTYRHAGDTPDFKHFEIDP